MASNVVAISEGVPEGLVSLAVGLVGVALARWVFVNREVRRTQRRESWSETLPLTLMAMLVTGVLVVEKDLSVSSSAFLGLGVGWVAVLLLDVFGDRVLAMFRGALAGGPASSDFPPKADISGNDGRVNEEVASIPEDMKALVARAEDRLEDSGYVRPPHDGAPSNASK